MEIISIHLNKHNIDYVKHHDLKDTKLKILRLIVIRFFMSWKSVQLCSFQPAYYFEFKKNELALQNKRFGMKKKLFYQHTQPLKYDIQTFHKRIMQMISIHHNKQNIWLRKTLSLKILAFTRETHFNELTNTV